MYWYFKSEKDRLQRKRIRDQSKGYGKPRIGGEFDLIDQNGARFTSDDMKGKFSLVRHLPRLRSGCLGLTPQTSRCVDLLWLLPLPGYLPRRARQDGSHD